MPQWELYGLVCGGYGSRGWILGVSMAGEKWTCVQLMVGVETSNGGGILPILLTMNWGVRKSQTCVLRSTITMLMQFVLVGAHVVEICRGCSDKRQAFKKNRPSSVVAQGGIATSDEGRLLVTPRALELL